MRAGEGCTDPKCLGNLVDRGEVRVTSGTMALGRTLLLQCSVCGMHYAEV